MAEEGHQVFIEFYINDTVAEEAVARVSRQTLYAVLAKRSGISPEMAL